MRPWLFGFVLCVLAAARACAGEFTVETGEDLRRFLLVGQRALNDEKINEDEEQILIAGDALFRGYVDGLEAIGHRTKGSPVAVPGNVTYGEMQKVVLKYLNAHPDRLKLLASALIYGALAEAYPNPALKAQRPGAK